MNIMQKAVLISGLGMLLAGCASVPEEQALQVWSQERTRWEEEEVALPEPGEEATLDDYVRYALLRNAGLRAAFERWKGALERVAPARSLADPRFTFGYFVREVETRVGPQRQRFGLAQSFPWAGKLDLKGRMALQAADGERHRYEAVRDKLAYQVKTAYYELYYLERAIEVTESNARLLVYLEEVARARYRGGVGRHGAVIKVQVELGKLEDRLRALRDMRRPLAARLNAALSRPVLAPVAVSGDLPAVDFDRGDQELIDLLRAGNSNLRVIEATAARAELAVELAKKNFYPDLTVGVDYVVTGDAEAAGMAPPADSGKDPVMAMASVNLPIWRDRYRAQEREARARHRVAVRTREEKENHLVAALEMALFGLRDGNRKVALYRDSLIPKAEQALSVIQQAFAAGESSFLELIDAQRVLLEFQLSFERARTDRARRTAEIEMLIGSDIAAAESETAEAD